MEDDGGRIKLKELSVGLYAGIEERKSRDPKAERCSRFAGALGFPGTAKLPAFTTVYPQLAKYRQCPTTTPPRSTKWQTPAGPLDHASSTGVTAFVPPHKLTPSGV
ncbi:hypothetical protein PAAG_12346 [Paracoccidioides lutzii Pb01]|uniref:Uncharacterized protein n=1 Tax=Paracoccidioides lutzii (strain ATCC MYA-826 / Pb01) TaxID=502779 RepID=A0A0A2V0D5_PARBA|nr:hypothetical protein PAAG_12346 [Paracoccidioides lutzii Pb01]KGQ00973.1 hypothetical protein PAAG_12346 [Paracoccidioides lutzii Pb01]